MDDLKSILRNINKKFGESTAQLGVPKLKEAGTLSLGSPSLDMCLYNSLPEGKFIEINGLESSGKTTLAFLIASDFIKKELIRNPDNPRKILFVDAESACDPEWAMKATGYDMNHPKVETIYLQGMGQTAEEFFDIVRELVSTGEVGLVIFDSLSMLVGQQVADKSFENKDMGGQAKPISDFCRRCVGIFNRYNCTFIGINGLYENVSGYGDPLQTGGGKQWKRTCMVRLRVKKGAPFDEEGNELKSSAESPAGNVIQIFVEKTKVCKWDRKLGFTNLNYSTGIDLIQDTIETAIYFGLIDNSTQGMFKLIDPNTGEILTDAEGNELKIRGKKNIKPYFKNNPQLFKNLYNKCYEILSKKEDTNVVAFEKLMGIDVKEVIGEHSDED